MRNSGMGGHQSAAMDTGEWLTPPGIIQALGVFFLDPCAPTARPWDTAYVHYTKLEDGLLLPWVGRVWCNPPYGRESARWLSKLAVHGEGTALIFARTETALFFNEVWPKASAVLFLQGRLYFHHVDGTRAASNAGAPSVLVSYGLKDADILENCNILGQFMRLRDA